MPDITKLTVDVDTTLLDQPIDCYDDRIRHLVEQIRLNDSKLHVQGFRFDSNVPAALDFATRRKRSRLCHGRKMFL